MFKYPISKDAFRRRLDKRTTIGYMSPSAFLAVAAPIDFTNEPNYSNTSQTSVQYHKHKILKHKEDHFMPFLMVEDDGQIVGHEGRHRAQAANELKVSKFPVGLVFMDRHTPFITPENWVNYDLLKEITQTSDNELLKRLAEEQKEMMIPDFCEWYDDELLKCKVKPELDYRSNNSKPRPKKTIMLDVVNL